MNMRYLAPAVLTLLSAAVLADRPVTRFDPLVIDLKGNGLRCFAESDELPYFQFSPVDVSDGTGSYRNYQPGATHWGQAKLHFWYGGGNFAKEGLTGFVNQLFANGGTPMDALKVVNIAVHRSSSDASLSLFSPTVTEVTFPGLDAASKDAAKMTIKFAPQAARWAKKSPDRLLIVDTNNLRQLSCPLYTAKLRIEGTDCDDVDYVSPLRVAVGDVNGDGIADMQYSPIRILCPRDPDGASSTQSSLTKWFHSTGSDGTPERRSGSIIYYNMAGQEVMTLDLVDLVPLGTSDLPGITINTSHVEYQCAVRTTRSRSNIQNN